jgi:hypothetical protein
MTHRAAVIAAAALAAVAIAASQSMTHTAGVSVALAAGTPSDTLTDENSPPTQQPAQSPAPPPAPTPAPAPPAAPAPTAAAQPPAPATPAPAKPRARIALPPKPADTLSESRPPKEPRGSSHAAGSPEGTETHARVTAVPHTTATAEGSVLPVADVSTVPRGPVQAGGGGSAAVHDISPEALVGIAAVLAVVAAGSGLALRRR